MKTVCKKLFCLMLVALMLVSAVPFAFAAEAVDVTIIYEEVNGDETTKDGAVYDDIDTISGVVNAFGDWSGYEITNWEVQGEHAATGSTDGPVNLVGATHVWIRVAKPAASCQHPNVTVTNNTTCENDGVKTTVCDDCGATVKTENITATGHSYNGATCSKCGATRNAIDHITFYFLDKNGNETSTVVNVYEDGAHITAPSVPVNPVSGFSYWAENENGGGMTLKTDEALVYNSQTPNAFHAIYNKKSAMSELKIYVVRYVNGVRKEANFLFSDYFTTSNDNQMYQYLWDNADDIRTAAIDELGAGYTWNEKFYNYFTDEELTDANMKDNGNKSVYIRMNTKNSNEAQVLLYVHKGKTSTVHDILEMDGYNAGEKVYLNNVKDFLKDEGYKWSSISSLYTDEEYDDLMDGESPSGSNHISITNNGTHVIHVILNGASQSNNADSSNPKTGDSIMVAVTTMTLAAAALVAVVELKKRKMI